MSWTSPRTWVAGETVTAALLNTHVRDNLLDLGGTSAAWSSFTGTWSAASAVAFSTNVCRYKRIGNTVHFQGSLVTSNSSGGGAWSIGLPVAPRATSSSVTPLGFAMYSVTAGSWVAGFIYRTSGGTYSFLGPGGQIAVAINVGSQLHMDLAYEAA